MSPIVPWSSERVNHPTQKPLQLMERIVTVFTNEADLVVDPFCGSGTTIVATKLLNRNGVGIDSCSDYVNIANNRLDSIIA